VSGEARESVRQHERPVIELELGILVYPPQAAGEPWRATFTESGQRRFRQAATEAKLAEKLEKVRERLSAGAANMEKPGAELIAHYLDPDRLPVARRWSRKHAHTQRRLCERFAAPVIATVTCQDIKASSGSRPEPCWPPAMARLPVLAGAATTHKQPSAREPPFSACHGASRRSVVEARRTR
jgi:hypothetical protein